MHFVKRPVAAVTLSFFISFCVFARYNYFISFGSTLVTGVLFAVSASLGIFLRRRGSGVTLRTVALVCLGVFISLLFAIKIFVYDMVEYEKYYENTYQVSGTVSGVCYESDNYCAYIYEVSEIDGTSSSLTAVLECNTEFDIGDVVLCNGTFEALSDGGSFDEKSYYMSRGARLKLVSEDSALSRIDFSSLKIKVARLNNKLYVHLTEKLSSKVSGVMGAVLLGNRSDLDDSTSRDFSRIGVSHLIAISGMHVSYICALIFFLTERAGVGKKQRGLICAFFLTFYMMLTGFSASVTRSVLLSCALSAVVILGISYDALTSVGICACAMILASPRFAFDIGMQMSFCAYIGCIAAGEITKKTIKITSDMSKAKRCVSRFLSSVVFTTSVVIFTLPVLYLYFDSVSVIAPLTNLIYIPMFSLILYLGILLIISSPIAPVFSALSFIAEKYVSFILFLSKSISRIKGITVSLGYPFTPYIIIIATAAIAFVAFTKRRVIRRASVILLAACIVFYASGTAYCKAKLESENIVYRVGNSSSDALLAVSGGKALICDVSSYYSAFAKAESEMKELCLTEPAAFLFTEYGEGELRTAKKLCNNYFVDCVYLAYPSNEETEYYFETMNILSDADISFVKLEDGVQSFPFANMKVSFFKESGGDDDKTAAVYIEFETRKSSMLYIGSAGGADSDAIMSNFRFDESTALVLGSYGTKPDKIVSELSRYSIARMYVFGSNAELSSLTDDVQALNCGKALRVTLGKE